MVGSPSENPESLSDLNTPTTPQMVRLWLHQNLAGTIPGDYESQVAQIVESLNNIFDNAIVIVSGHFIDQNVSSPETRAAMTTRGEGWFKIGGNTEVSMGGNQFAERGAGHSRERLVGPAVKEAPYETLMIDNCETTTYPPDKITTDRSTYWKRLRAAVGIPVTHMQYQGSKKHVLTSTAKIQLGKTLPKGKPAQVIYAV